MRREASPAEAWADRHRQGAARPVSGKPDATPSKKPTPIDEGRTARAPVQQNAEPASATEAAPKPAAHSDDDGVPMFASLGRKSANGKNKKKPAPEPQIPPPPAGGGIPTFGSVQPLGTEGKKKRQDSRVAAGVVLAMLLGAGGYLGLGTSQQEGTASQTAQSPGGSGALDQWIPNWSEGDAGEDITLFGPSQEWSDYRVQWETGEKESFSWIFRAVDIHNYYAVELERRPEGTLRLVKYALIKGARTNVSESSLDLPGPEKARYGVELEVQGARFRLYVEGHSVAEWSDDRLERGGFGVVRPGLGFAGVGDVKVTPLGAESASSRPPYWRGLTPDRLPEVNLLRPGGQSGRGEADSESTL